MILYNKNSIDYYGEIDKIKTEMSKGNQIQWFVEDLLRPYVHDYLKIELDVDSNKKKSSEYWSKKAALLSDEDFLEFFNKTSPEYSSSFEEGSKHFHDLVMNVSLSKDTTVSDFLGDTSEKTCLEIGFGGGRLIQEACKVFKCAKGIDIHQYFERVESILLENDLKNFELINSKDKKKTKTDSVDLVYSLIVMQHVDTLDEIISHIENTRRILKKDGLAVLYFGINNILPSVGALEITGHEEGGYSMLFNIEFLSKLLELKKLKPVAIDLTENMRQFSIVAKPIL